MYKKLPSDKLNHSVSEGGQEMTNGKYQIFTSFIGGKKVYRVGRLIDPSEPLHGGNVIYAKDENGSPFIRDITLAEAVCFELNKGKRKE